MNTNFKCHTCGKHHYTKQNLIVVDGHLICQNCTPVYLPIIWTVEYSTKRGLVKSTHIKIDDELEVKNYVLDKLKAKCVNSIVRYQ